MRVEKPEPEPDQEQVFGAPAVETAGSGSGGDAMGWPPPTLRTQRDSEPSSGTLQPTSGHGQLFGSYYYWNRDEGKEEVGKFIC